MSSEVKPTIDEGWYQCVVEGYDGKNGFSSEKTSLEMLNITGNIKMNKRCLHIVETHVLWGDNSISVKEFPMYNCLLRNLVVFYQLFSCALHFNYCI